MIQHPQRKRETWQKHIRKRMNSLKGSSSAPASNFYSTDDAGVHYNALQPWNHTPMCATEGSCSLFHGQPINFFRVSVAPDAKNVPQGTVTCRIPSHEPCAHVCKSILHLGGVSMQKQLCGQLVCSKSACDRHATHLQSRPARKGTHTQGVTNSWHAHAYLEPISRKIGPCHRLSPFWNFAADRHGWQIPGCPKFIPKEAKSVFVPL